MKENVVLRGAIVAGLLVTLAIGTGCKRGPQTPAAQFPATNEIAGWTQTGDIRTFAAQDLWKYIDGDAEKYLKAGAKSVSTADYKFQNRIEAVVDVYTMGSAEGARKIFDSEPAGDGKQTAVGDAARSSGQNLLFIRGPYLVRIVAYQESAETQQAILQLGQGVEKRFAD